MAAVAPASVDGDVVMTDAVAKPAAPPVEENETIYIQNLNEKIKIPSTPHPPCRFACNAYNCGSSYETDVAKLV